MTLSRAPYCYSVPRPQVTTELVILTLRERALWVLLTSVRATGAHMLPGGLLRANENLDDSARRLLHEYTDADVYLEQLYTFDQPRRAARDSTISVAYYALIPSENIAFKEHSSALVWHPLDDLPELAHGHGTIVRAAHLRLAAKLEYSTIAMQFMPEKFTLTELQEVYECILREPLDKRNFRKRVLALSVVKPTKEMRRNGAHRPARLYRNRNPGKLEFIRVVT